MRRLVSVGLFSVLVPAVLALPVTTAHSAPTPHPVGTAVQSLAVTGVDPAALAGDAVAPAGRSRPFLLTGKKATQPFTTIGVTWQPDSGSSAVTVSVRTRGDDGWSPWSTLEVADDEGPDEVSSEARAAGVRVGTAPTWVGEADGAQVRLDVPSGPPPRDVRLELVDPGESTADATLGQLSAPQSTASAATRRPTIISRAQWGADESLRNGSPSYSPKVKVAYVNHTASTNDYTAEEAAQQVRSFYAYHTKSLGWGDIGYNFLVDKFGRVYEGRYGGIERAVIGAHAGGFNTGTMGVAMIGTYSTVAPSSATLTALRDLLAWKLSLSGADPLGKQVLTSGGGSTSRYRAGTDVTVNVIAGHRDTNNTVCPGDQGYSALPGLRRGVADQISRTDASSGATSPAGPAAPSGDSSTTPAIDAKYVSLGGPSGYLGAQTAAEAAASTGRFRPYSGGAIYWSPASNAFAVKGRVLERWGTLGRQSGPLGFPVTDETVTPDRIGRFNHFQGGSIYWTGTSGAWEVRGAIRDTWSRFGWELGPLGYPLTNESVTQDGIGRYNHFQRGSIYWTPAIGAREVRGAIRQRWSSMGWENGPLGYPTSNEYDVPGGRRSDFQQGSVLWDAATGATTVR